MTALAIHLPDALAQKIQTLGLLNDTERLIAMFEREIAKQENTDTKPIKKKRFWYDKDHQIRPC